MNFKHARELLELQHNFSLQDLKKNYHMKALKTHPDKCIDDPSASERFKEINDAYHYLLDYLSVNGEKIGKESQENNSYNDLLFKFLNIDHNTIHSLITKITQGYHNITVAMFENMEKNNAIDLYNFVVKYKDILHINDLDMTKIKNIIREKVKNDNVYILNPSLEDLFNYRIFKLKCGEDIFYVPLWHSELQFSCSGEDSSDINVLCIPELPDNITIDHYNNIHLNINLSLDGILERDVIDIYLCDLEQTITADKKRKDKDKKFIHIKVSDLRIKKYQTIVVRNEGIAIINTDDSYNIEKLSDIVVHITLTQ